MGLDKDKLHEKFLALNVDFNGPNLDLLGSRKHVHDNIKCGTPKKSLFYRSASLA